MSDIEKDLREQLTVDAARVQALPRDLWLRIVDGSGDGMPGWLRVAPIAVVVLFVVTAGVLLARAQRPAGGAGPVAASTASPSPRHTATARPAPQASPTPNLDLYTCGAAPTGGSAGAGGNLTAVRVAHQAGFDRITFQFAGTGIPAFAITQQAGTHFTQDASGKPIDLQGIAAIKIVFHNASGAGTYTGSIDIKLPPGAAPDKSSIDELREIGDFERVFSWAAGLNTKPACLRVQQLDGPARLVIDVRDNP